MRIFGLLFLSSLLFIFACDKIDDPFPPNENVVDTGIVWDDSAFSPKNNGERFVMMEEYTGHICKQCPPGTREIVRLQGIYGHKFVPISVHSDGFFAAPAPGYYSADPTSFLSDHRTSAGEDYQSEFRVAALPGGVVNRKIYSFATEYKLNISQWKRAIDEDIEEPAVANLNLSNYYNDSTKTFQVRISIEWLENYNGNYNLQVQMIEDSVIDWQQDGSDFIEDYVHRHMLRATLNGTWGWPLTETALNGSSTDTLLTRAFDPNGVGYKVDDVVIVAFLYKRSPEYEVMQVNEAHLTSH